MSAPAPCVHCIVGFVLLAGASVVPEALGQRLDVDACDPLDVIDEAVPVPQAVSVVLPVVSVALALVLTDADEEESTGRLMQAGGQAVFSQAGYYASCHESRTDVFEGGVGGSINVRRWLNVGIELHATRLRDERIGTGAVGGRLFVRWHVLNRRRTAQFFEQGLGLIASRKPFPPGGTRLNFTPVYGISAVQRVTEKMQLVVGLRHYHISNAGLAAGADRNPGFDSNGVYVGYRFVR
jgi:hypothetical protein